jgi:hypothetical protein
MESIRSPAEKPVTFGWCKARASTQPRPCTQHK